MFPKLTRKHWLFFLLVLALWLIIPQFFIRYTHFFSGWFGNPEDLEATFAPVNALFSGLAFAILIITILQQQESIDSSNEQSYRQSFENNFFQMLSIHTNNIKMLRCNDRKFYGEGNTYSDRQMIRFLYKCLQCLYQIKTGTFKKDDLFVGLTKSGVKNLSSLIKKIEQKGDEKIRDLSYYMVFSMLAKESISHCHRHIYHILKYIDESVYSDDEKMKYVRILRAQMCNYEFVLLFYSSIFHRENKFKKLIEKYAFFHNLDKTLLYNTDHQFKYEETAYGSKGYEKDIVSTEVFVDFDVSV